MKPIGPLMKEHRLIEKMINLLNEHQSKLSKTRKLDVNFIQIAVDFFRTYADRTHHGKEEDILFKELAGKQLAAEHKQLMKELIEEHIQARNLVSSLIIAKDSYLRGNPDSFSDIIKIMNELAAFYPPHILKEDKQFFYPCLEYFTSEEQSTMLNKFWEFDRLLIHEKYQKVVTELSKD